MMWRWGYSIYFRYTFYHIQMGLGNGTNNFAELIIAKYFIQFGIEKHCHSIQVFDDLKIVCSWINKTSTCHAFTL